jgi:predicted NBD/HSP70 family sugar kinase
MPPANHSPQFLDRPYFASVTDNERLLLGLIMRKGPMTQSAIAQEIGVTQQSISRIVSSLLDRNIVRTGERVQEGKRGLASATVELVPEFAYTLGVSIMADAISIAVMDFAGKVLSAYQGPMETMTRANVMEEVQARAEKMIAEKVPDRSRLFAVGVGISGYLVGEGARFNTPATLQDWALVDVEEIFSSAFHLPVWVDNDGNVAAIGESMVGVGQWAKNFAYLYHSNGFGGGLVMNGELVRGDNGNAGEYSAILPYYIYPHPNLELLRQTIARHGIDVPTVYDLVTKFDPNWPGVDEWITKVRDSFCLICSAISAILDNTAIVLGGRMPRALAEKIITSIEFYNMPRRSKPRPVPKVVPAEAAGEATAIGAAALPFKKTFFG